MQKLVLAAGLTCLLTAGSIKAQAAPVIASSAEAAKVLEASAATAKTPDTGPREWKTIKLQYAKPSIMAWWLDPAHQTEPAELVEGRKLLESVGALSSQLAPPKEPAERKGVFDLPAGVDEIKADDTQRTLAALTSEKGLESLQRIVSFLDQPLRAVGINVDVIETDEESIRQLAGDFPSQGAQSTFLSKEAPAELEKLITSGAVRILASYQLTAKNSFPIGDTAMLEAFGENNKRQARLSLVVTPTINTNKTVTVLLNLSGDDRGSVDPLLSSYSFRTTTIVNVRNRDSILISGLNFASWEVPHAITPANPVAVQVKRIYVLLRTQILEGKRFQ